MTTVLAIVLASAAPAESSPEMLETLVKLASAGTSGICVLAIFWCGLSIMRLPNDAPRNKHVTMRFFMGTCVVVAIISAATTFGAGYWDYKRVATLRAENQALVATNTAQRTTLEQVRTDLSAIEGRLQVATREKTEFAQNVQLLTAQVSQLENAHRGALEEVARLRGQLNVRESRITDLESRLRVRPGAAVVPGP